MTESTTTPQNVPVADLRKGDCVVIVEDTLLAAAMVAVGIPPRSPGMQKERFKNKPDKFLFLFFAESADGTMRAEDCLKAWKEDLDFIKNNPKHPFAFAMAAVKNYKAWLEQMNTTTPYLKFSATGNTTSAVVSVLEGSKKHQACINRGLKQL